MNHQHKRFILFVCYSADKRKRSNNLLNKFKDFLVALQNTGLKNVPQHILYYGIYPDCTTLKTQTWALIHLLIKYYQYWGDGSIFKACKPGQPLTAACREFPALPVSPMISCALRTARLEEPRQWATAACWCGDKTLRCWQQAISQLYFSFNKAFTRVTCSNTSSTYSSACWAINTGTVASQKLLACFMVIAHMRSYCERAGGMAVMCWSKCEAKKWIWI